MAHFSSMHVLHHANGKTRFLQNGWRKLQIYSHHMAIFHGDEFKNRIQHANPIAHFPQRKLVPHQKRDVSTVQQPYWVCLASGLTSTSPPQADLDQPGRSSAWTAALTVLDDFNRHRQPLEARDLNPKLAGAKGRELRS